MNKKEIRSVQKPNAELTREDIASYIEAIRFRKKLFGGLDSIDVWKKLRKLDAMYAAVSDNQKLQYEALIKERDQQLRDKILPRDWSRAMTFNTYIKLTMVTK